MEEAAFVSGASELAAAIMLGNDSMYCTSCGQALNRAYAEL